MRDATKVCVQEPIEERIPKAITQCEPCDDEIQRWRNLNSILRERDRKVSEKTEEKSHKQLNFRKILLGWS
jgi:hypothetical protein